MHTRISQEMPWSNIVPENNQTGIPIGALEKMSGLQRPTSLLIKVVTDTCCT